MKTSSIIASDGTRLVYDEVGNGRAIMLLHGGGGGQSRQSWHEAGHVARLQDQFKVITMDICGHGDSDKPTDPAAYQIETMCSDVLAVANACAIENFALWGFSYGGNIGRYLAASSRRVSKLIVMGIPFGLAAGGENSATSSLSSGRIGSQFCRLAHWIWRRFLTKIGNCWQ